MQYTDEIKLHIVMYKMLTCTFDPLNSGLSQNSKYLFTKLVWINCINLVSKVLTDKRTCRNTETKTVG